MLLLYSQDFFKLSNRSISKQTIYLLHFLRNGRGFLLSQEEDGNNRTHQLPPSLVTN